MKLTAATVAAVALCLISLAARSHALRAAAAAAEAARSGTLAENPGEHVRLVAGEKVALVAIDGHLRHKLRKLALR